jgi:hypothetical protein
MRCIALICTRYREKISGGGAAHRCVRGPCVADSLMGNTRRRAFPGYQLEHCLNGPRWSLSGFDASPRFVRRIGLSNENRIACLHLQPESQLSLQGKVEFSWTCFLVVYPPALQQLYNYFAQLLYSCQFILWFISLSILCTNTPAAYRFSAHTAHFFSSKESVGVDTQP